MAGQDIGYQVVDACIASIVISTVAIILRIWSRIVSDKVSFWWDDYFALFGWLFGVANCALSLYWVQDAGLGKHMSEVLSEGITTAQTMLPVFVEDFLYNTGITMVKLSALCFYGRIFRVLPRFKMALYIAAGLVVAWWITFTVLAICTCNPVQKQWKSEIPGHCLDEHATFIAAATPNVAIDLYILLLPMPVVWPLAMELRRRIALVVIFAMGYCVMIVSIIRLVTVVQFQQAGDDDFTWDWTEPQILVILEVPLGVFSICLPTMLQLAKRGMKDGWQSLLQTGRLGRSWGTSFSTHAPLVEPSGARSSSSESGWDKKRFAASLGSETAVQSSVWAQRDRHKERFDVPEQEIRVDFEMESESRSM